MLCLHPVSTRPGGGAAGFEQRDPRGLQPPLHAHHFLSVAQGTWTRPRVARGQLRVQWKRRPLSGTLAAVGRVRSEEAGGQGARALPSLPVYAFPT